MCNALKNSLVCLNYGKDIRKGPQTSSEALSPILYDFQFYSADLLDSVRTTQKHISDHINSDNKQVLKLRLSYNHIPNPSC